jgi:membrane protein implicated in regulation of membrane protease activity
MTTMAYVWLAVAVVLAVWEAMTTNLVSMWFVGGAVAAFLTVLLGGGLLVQLIVFTVVSAALLAAMRPLVKKRLLVKDPIRTNVNRLLGTSGIVTEPIDNLRATGAVRLGGVEWTARSADGGPIPKDAQVKVLRIEGVKAIVETVEAKVNA